MQMKLKNENKEKQPQQQIIKTIKTKQSKAQHSTAQHSTAQHSTAQQNKTSFSEKIQLLYLLLRPAILAGIIGTLLSILLFGFRWAILVDWSVLQIGIKCKQGYQESEKNTSDFCIVIDPWVPWSLQSAEKLPIAILGPVPRLCDNNRRFPSCLSPLFQSES